MEVGQAAESYQLSDLAGSNVSSSHVRSMMSGSCRTFLTPRGAGSNLFLRFCEDSKISIRRSAALLHKALS